MELGTRDKVLLLLLWVLCFIEYEQADGLSQTKEIIDVNNGGNLGEWTTPEICPVGYVARGFSLKVESNQGIGDDTALNGIRLHCSRGNVQPLAVESESGKWGMWTTPLWCSDRSFLVAFSLRVEHSSFLDSTAANNIRFRCSDGLELEGSGLKWGEYGEWSKSCSKGICGLQTKLEKPRDSFRDDTALNDVILFCCS
ncbi:vitelline membrane outer layer protein 1 homolog [Nannospalax galili]|uniref:Vitelline membrane outer layer 1 homolog (chicken) n=1 Tax=Nannospalax galili TaxID=1026970 RepID=A0A8C6WB08_NANGA|nr:vitelline membrane outer layer protein 1 homolog [Nannospalax galili]